MVGVPIVILVGKKILGRLRQELFALMNMTDRLIKHVSSSSGAEKFLPLQMAVGSSP